VNRRPKLTILGTSASPAEAAAVIAAVERFMRDTAPLPAPAAAPRNQWLRRARLEAVASGGSGSAAWGDGHPWG
jgi:hypothetical protein